MLVCRRTLYIFEYSLQWMADALKTDPINELEENLECTVCLEPLKDPRTLSCFHSFCKDCLEDVVKTWRDKELRRGRPVREIPCPYCREMFTLDPDKHVADMRRNLFICKMVNATAVLDRGTGVSCSHDCSQSFSVARCVTCEKFLFSQCLTDHNKYRANIGHSVLTMEELSKPENRKKSRIKCIAMNMARYWKFTVKPVTNWFAGTAWILNTWSKIILVFSLKM